VRHLLKQVGVRPERFALDWASAAEAPLFVSLITDFTETIRDLGPLGNGEGIPLKDLKLRLTAAISAAKGTKIRVQAGKLALELRRMKDYAPEVIEEKMAERLNDVISREIEKHGVGI
jgi:hypothetical protein